MAVPNEPRYAPWTSNINLNNTGYASNQFLNITQNGETTLSRQPTDNPKFAYPGDVIPNVYDDLSKGALGSLPVQRGFIRGIFPEILKKAETSKKGDKYKGYAPPSRRCFFQFNPSLILRQVQASSTTLNPLLQDPSQLLQAIPGQASFEFQLLFNREKEVAGQVYMAGNKLEPTRRFSENLEAYGDGAAAYNQNQVGDLGVLVDLYVLDSIIGQSITSDTIKTVRAYWEASRGLRGTGELDSNGKPINPYAEEDFISEDSKYQKSLENVLGNTAFLNPMPIRIVFSSLFMVEGFVTASAVAFHKFSKNMVPTVCQVTLSVQALYIGFAKSDSYISNQLLEQINKDIENSTADQANLKVTKTLLQEHTATKLANMGFSYWNWDTIDNALVNFNIPKGIPYSLNSWWKAIYDFNKTTPNNIPFSLSQQVNTESFRFYTSDNFKERARKGNPKDLKVVSVKLYFYDKKDIKDSSELQRASNLGKLPGGVYKGIKPIAKCVVSKNLSKYNNVYPITQSPKTEDLSTLVSEDLVAGSKSVPYEVDWITDDMAPSFNEDRIKKQPTKYFGDRVVILAQLTLEGIVSGTDSGDKSQRVIKTVVREMDSDTSFGYQDTFGLDFDFTVSNNRGDNA